MVSIGNPYAKAHEYERDNYYTKGEHTEIAMIGEIAKELNIKSFSDGTYQRLIQGQDQYGRTLVEPGVNGYHRPGKDFTFSPEKSLSIAHAFGSRGQRQAVENAHNRAVMNCMNYIERNVIQARITKDGVTEQVKTGKMIASVINHYISRECDPQLHSHAVIYNITRTENGYRAISNESLYQNEKLIMRAYDNELAKELSKEGFKVAQTKEGYTYLPEIDEQAKRIFSKRAEMIEAKKEELREQHPDWSRKQIEDNASEWTRKKKTDKTIDQMKAEWNETLEKSGMKPSDIEQSITMKNELARGYTAGEYIDRAINNISETKSAFTKGEILTEALDMSAGRVSLDKLETAFSDNLDLKTLGEFNLKKNFREEVFTTIDTLEKEHQIIEIAKGQQGTREAFGDYLYQHETSLRPEQYDAYKQIAQSTDGVILLQGNAGTGKTYLMEQVKETAQKNGYEVIGLSFTGKAASGLAESLKIETQTVSKFLASEKRPDGKTLIILDEAGTLGTRQTYEILKLAEQNPELKILMTGDVKQHPSIASGRAFADLQENLPKAELTQIVRQTNEAYKEIVANLSAREIETAQKKLENNKGMIAEITEKAERIISAVNLFMMNPATSLIITNTNQVKDALNEKVRETLIEKGVIEKGVKILTKQDAGLSKSELSKIESYEKGMTVNFFEKSGEIKKGETGIITEIDEARNIVKFSNPQGVIKTFEPFKEAEKLNIYQTRPLELSAGDRVQFQKNNTEIGVMNGETATVKEIDKNYLTVEKDGKTVNINLRQYNNLDYGYAMTNYEGQGLTTKRIIANLETGREYGGQSYNSVYVAVSRGKEECKIITDNKKKLFEQMGIEQGKTLAKDYEKIANIEHERENEKEHKRSFGMSR